MGTTASQLERASAVDPIAFGIDAAACLAHATLAPNATVAAQWVAAATEIARCGGEAMLPPPDHLIGCHSLLHDTWTEAYRIAEARLNRPPVPVEPYEWKKDDALFPIDDLEQMSEEDLLLLAAGNLHDAIDMVDGSSANAQVRIDIAQDYVEQAVMTLILRGMHYTDEKLAPYVELVRDAKPRQAERPEPPDITSLALWARRAFRIAQMHHVGDTWVDFPTHLSSAQCAGINVELGITFEQIVTIAYGEALERRIQAVTCGAVVLLYASTGAWGDPKSGIKHATLCFAAEPSLIQRDAVLALFNEPEIGYISARVVLDRMFEGKHYTSTSIKLDWGTYSTRGRRAQTLFSQAKELEPTLDPAGTNQAIVDHFLLDQRCVTHCL